MSEAVGREFHVVLECGHHRAIKGYGFRVDENMNLVVCGEQAECVAVYSRDSWQSCEEVGVGSPAWPISGPSDAAEHEDDSAA